MTPGTTAITGSLPADGAGRRLGPQRHRAGARRSRRAGAHRQRPERGLHRQRLVGLGRPAPGGRLGRRGRHRWRRGGVVADGSGRGADPGRRPVGVRRRLGRPRCGSAPASPSPPPCSPWCGPRAGPRSTPTKTELADARPPSPPTGWSPSPPRPEPSADPPSPPPPPLTKRALIRRHRDGSAHRFACSGRRGPVGPSGAADRRVGASGWGRRWRRARPAVRPVRAAMISAQMATAVSSGVRPPRSSPIGACSRARTASMSAPSASSRSSRSRIVRRLPMAPR